MDELVFVQMGKHLDSLQSTILKGVLNGQKYTEIAEDYKCTAGHAKDEVYERWRILSEALGEDLNKANVRAAVERVIATNSNLAGNPVQIGSINLCPNFSQTMETSEVDDLELVDIGVGTPIEAIQQAVKLETVPQLIKLGLTADQIAQVLGLSPDDVRQTIC
jgi:hypothetical protein